MNAFDIIYGNDEVKALFSQCITDNKLSHAYMLVGPNGCGKKTFVNAIAQNIAQHDHAEEDAISRIATGHSPDVLSIPTEEKRIGIDTVRSFVSTVYLTPNELDFKMYIFDKADRLTPQAQNALLKIIEEPPKRVYIFLLCENPASLLQTVRSRVIAVNMQTFSEEQVRDYIKKSAPELSFSAHEERLDFALRISRGAIGAVKDLMDTENIEFEAFSKAKEMISALSRKNRGVSYFDFISIILLYADNSEKLSILLKYLALFYRDVLSAQNSDEAEIITLTEDEAVRFASVFPVSSVLNVLNTITEVTRNMAFNSNLVLASTYLAENLWHRT
jgi:DNA polymerase-3 subunit delta'